MKDKLKVLNIRIPRELWAFCRKKSFDRDISFNKLMLELLEKYKKRCENKLTGNDTIV